MPPEAPVYVPEAPAYPPEGYAPAVLPPQEVYAVLRESGYSPLGVPRLRGLYYTIAAISLDGDDGRLVIDARSGRIVRFVPAWRVGHLFEDEAPIGYGAPAALPPRPDYRGTPRPPVSVPRLASRAPVPLPKPMPPRAVGEPKAEVRPEVKAGAVRPAAPSQPPQAVASQAKPADSASTTAPVPVEAKPAAPAIQQTQPMPPAQGF
jgi:hypothetical protein